MSRVLRLLIVAFAAVVLVATPASAGQDSYAPTNVEAEPLDNGNIRITGDGCPRNGEITYVVRRGAPQGQGPEVTRGSAMANEDGEFDFIIDMNGRRGQFTITVTCGGNSTVLSVNTAAGGATPGPLPRTGDDSVPLARLGAVLVAIGGIAVYAAKKRSKRRPLVA